MDDELSIALAQGYNNNLTFAGMSPAEFLLNGQSNQNATNSGNEVDVIR